MPGRAVCPGLPFDSLEDDDVARADFESLVDERAVTVKCRGCRKWMAADEESARLSRFVPVADRVNGWAYCTFCARARKATESDRRLAVAGRVTGEPAHA